MHRPNSQGLWNPSQVTRNSSTWRRIFTTPKILSAKLTWQLSASFGFHQLINNWSHHCQITTNKRTNMFLAWKNNLWTQKHIYTQPLWRFDKEIEIPCTNVALWALAPSESSKLGSTNHPARKPARRGNPSDVVGWKDEWMKGFGNTNMYIYIYNDIFMYILVYMLKKCVKKTEHSLVAALDTNPYSFCFWVSMCLVIVTP